jgi:predicted regulator of Ras-like GTPase activity (Roadblock/LC7/MglB family)
LTHPYQQALVERMRVLQRSSPEIEAAALISQDGLIIASALKPEIDPDRISAMSASILSLGEQIGKETNIGTLEQVYLQGENGHVVLMSVGEGAVLTALVTAQAKIGVLLLDMRHAAEDLQKVLLFVE